MDAAFSPPCLDDRQTTLRFVLEHGGRRVDGSITLDALEQYFWLPSGASVAQVFKVFDDGRHRILAMATRKWLSSGAGQAVALTARDFGVHA